MKEWKLSRIKSTQTMSSSEGTNCIDVGVLMKAAIQSLWHSLNSGQPSEILWNVQQTRCGLASK